MPVDPIYLDPHWMALQEAAKARRFAARNELTPEEIHRRSAARMAEIDALPQVWRELVHEHGWPKVQRWLAERRNPLALMIDFEV